MVEIVLAILELEVRPGSVPRDNDTTDELRKSVLVDTKRATHGNVMSGGQVNGSGKTSIGWFIVGEDLIMKCKKSIKQ